MNTNNMEGNCGARHIDPIEVEEADGGGNFLRVVGAGAAIVALVAIAFVTYTVHHKDDLATQANTFASTFITSSPVVEQQLGAVQQVRVIKEQHQTGKAPGWYLAYDVSGRRMNGVVDMRLTPNPDFDLWNVHLAKLDIGHKTINLR
jgi:hypothetical protein